MRTAIELALIVAFAGGAFFALDQATFGRETAAADRAALTAHALRARSVGRVTADMLRRGAAVAETLGRSGADGVPRHIAWHLGALAAQEGHASHTVRWRDGRIETLHGEAPGPDALAAAASAASSGAPAFLLANQAEGARRRPNLFVAHPVLAPDGRVLGVSVLAADRDALLAAAPGPDAAPDMAELVRVVVNGATLGAAALDPEAEARASRAVAEAAATGGPALVSAAPGAPHFVASAVGGDAAGVVVATRHVDAAQTHHDHLVSGVAAALTAMALCAVWLTAVHAPRRARRRLAESIELAQSGDIVIIEGVERRDDVGDLARSVERLALHGARLRATLNASDTMVMIADRGGRIFYANSRLVALFAEHIERFSQQFPDVKFPNVIGAHLDAFQLGLTAQDGDAEGVLRGRIVAGGRKLDAFIAPVKDRFGARIGAFAQWEDVTSELEIESEIGNMVEMIAMGELDSEMSLSNRAGVFATVADGVNALLRTLRESVVQLNDVMSAMAKGDLSRSMGGDLMGAFGELGEHVNGTVGQIARTVARIRIATEGLNAAVEALQGNTAMLSARSSEAMVALTETNRAAEALTALIAANAARAREADALSGRTRASAEKGASVARDATEAMRAIEASSAKVNDIAGVIDEIAFQTNMLALNAAVEAARAGDAGRGFGVVASEVRSLSQRVAASANDIKTLLGRSNAEVRRGVALARESGGALTAIEGDLRLVSDVIAAISADGLAQERDMTAMDGALSRLGEITQENAAMAQDAAESIGGAARLAESLAEAVEFFTGVPEDAGDAEAGGADADGGDRDGEVGASLAAFDADAASDDGEDDWRKHLEESGEEIRA